MAAQNYSTPLSLLAFGCSPYMASIFTDRMRSQGVDAVAMAIPNTVEGDALVAQYIGSRNWSCWMAGPGLTQDLAWFSRVVQIAKRANPNVPMLVYQGQGDVENAILRQLGVRLPLATV